MFVVRYAAQRSTASRHSVPTWLTTNICLADSLTTVFGVVLVPPETGQLLSINNDKVVEFIPHKEQIDEKYRTYAVAIFETKFEETACLRAAPFGTRAYLTPPTA
jgi:hypothetical protein